MLGGSVMCEITDINGKKITKDYHAPAAIEVAKTLYHKFTALESNTTLHCIFALRDEDGILCLDCSNCDPKSYQILG